MKHNLNRRQTVFILSLAALLLAACAAGEGPGGATTPAPGISQPEETTTPEITPAIEETDLFENPIITAKPLPATTNPQPGVPENPVSPASPHPGEELTPYAPQPADAALQRGLVFLEAVNLLTRESFPPQFQLELEGTLPTPCHELRVDIAAPDNQGRIIVTAYSVVDPNMICTQVLHPFAVSLPLKDVPSGAYSVIVNDQPAGQIVMP